MKNEIDPVEGKDGWNSAQEAVPGLSCMGAAKWLSSFTSAFRAMVLVEQNLGIEAVIDQAIKILQAQRDTIEKHKLSITDAGELMQRTSLAIGQALVCIGGIDPQYAGILASKAIAGMLEAKDKIGHDKFNESIIRFNVRKHENGDLEISTDAVSMAAAMKKEEKKIDEEAGKITDAVLQFGLKKINEVDLNKIAKVEQFPQPSDKN